MLTKIFYHILGLLVAFCLLFAVLITVTETLLYRVDGYFAKEYSEICGHRARGYEAV